MKRRLHAAVFAGLAAVSATAHAEREIDAPHCLYGCPMGASSNNNLIVRAAYILSSNDITKFADWAAYRVTPRAAGKSVKRGGYAADPALAPEETLESRPDDYKGANYRLQTDRGHQAPFAALAGLPKPHALNYLSNITPQKSALNRGAWKNLETAVRRLAKDTGEVYVMTGPLYQRPMPQLPQADEAHLVPSGYWKIAAVRGDKGGVTWAAFVFPQDTPAGAPYCGYASTIRAIERLTGLEFFHGVSGGESEDIKTSAPELRAGLGCA